MKILIAIDNPDLQDSDFLQTGNIKYSPDLADAPPEELIETLILHSATALITAHRPPGALLRVWSDRVGGCTFLTYAVGTPHGPRVPGLTEFRLRGNELDSIAEALRHCEMWFTSTHRPPQPVLDALNTKEQVVLVGAGIINLITAIYLVESGYQVTLLDRSPAPGGADWRRYGGTHAGDDARMFTLTEMDNYSNRNFLGRPHDRFHRTIDRNGWLAKAHDPVDAAENAWLKDYARIPSWLARVYNDDVFLFNAEAQENWKRMRHDHPWLFEDVMFTDGVLRVYSDRAQLDESLARHRRLDAVLHELSSIDIAREFPAFARPVARGALIGGFLVPGFTVNVHKFTRKIISMLESRGVAFYWETPVTAVERDSSGAVIGFNCVEPIPDTAHVVVSPGAHGNELLAGSPCAEKIHAVLGGWIRVSNRGLNLGNSVKVARRGQVAEDANVTVAVDESGQEVLIVGSGYGYLGTNPDAVDSHQLTALRLSIQDTIEELFPDRVPLRPSSHAGENYTFKFCVRPWTATSLGIYHVETTAHGRLFVINGGHNTGGFAQSPTVAQAVLASLSGRWHPMHALYHPERFNSFADTDTIASIARV